MPELRPYDPPPLSVLTPDTTKSAPQSRGVDLNPSISHIEKLLDEHRRSIAEANGLTSALLAQTDRIRAQQRTRASQSMSTVPSPPEAQGKKSSSSSRWGGNIVNSNVSSGKGTDIGSNSAPSLNTSSSSRSSKVPTHKASSSAHWQQQKKGTANVSKFSLSARMVIPR